MKNNWKFYTTHEGISFIRNESLDEKNYFRMKIFMKNHFKNRYIERAKKQPSLLYSIVKSVSGEKNGNVNEMLFSCELSIDQHKIGVSWSETEGVSVVADSREGNCVIRELYNVLKENSSNEFWAIVV